jgi:pimeloyl-ACP methyl ester carboxylesterase
VKRVLFAAALLYFLIVSPMRAQDVSGDWQGAVGTGEERLRFILHVDQSADGASKAKFFSIDQGPDGIPVSAITLYGAELVFSIADLKLSYRGTVSVDGTSIVGKMKQGGTSSVTLHRPTSGTAWPRDIHCACTASFISVEKGVKLEILDWGGAGRPLILLAGLGDTAHGFDDFAHKLVKKYHVYGITRRGFGESDSPPPSEANYDADRLGDDVLAVIDALRLVRPVLAGHSIAGEELSSVGSRHPEKIAGLIYLEAAYEYAFYDRAKGDVNLDANEVRKELGNLVEKFGVDNKSLSELITQLPALEKELQEQRDKLAKLPPPEPAHELGPEEAIMLGQRKYTKITSPVLAIFADPHDLGPMPEYNAAGRAAMAKLMADHTTTHRSEFEAGVPSAQVVSIPNADHYVFKSNESEVLKEMDKFIAALPHTD